MAEAASRKRRGFYTIYNQISGIRSLRASFRPGLRPQNFRRRIAEFARRLPHARSERRGALRRQGARPEKAGGVVLPEAGGEPAHAGDARQGARPEKAGGVVLPEA